MAKKFDFGKLLHVVSDAKFAGQQATVSHDRIVKPALFEADADTTYEFGEIVVITGNTKTNYIVKNVDETITSDDKFGVVMNEITGATTIHGQIIDTALPNVVLNIWGLEDNLDAIVVPVFENDKEVEIDGEVFLGNGEEGTVAGGIYTEEVIDGTIKLEGFVFKSEANKPTTGSQKTAAIGRK